MLDTLAYASGAALFLAVAAMAGTKAGRLLGGWPYEAHHWIKRWVPLD